MNHIPTGRTPGESAARAVAERLARIEQGEMDLLLGKLATRTTCSVKELSQALKISVRTIHSMLEVGRIAGAELVEREQGGRIEHFGLAATSRVVPKAARRAKAGTKRTAARVRTKWVLTVRGVKLWLAESLTTEPGEHYRRVADLALTSLSTPELKALQQAIFQKLQTSKL